MHGMFMIQSISMYVIVNVKINWILETLSIIFWHYIMLLIVSIYFWLPFSNINDTLKSIKEYQNLIIILLFLCKDWSPSTELGQLWTLDKVWMIFGLSLYFDLIQNQALLCTQYLQCTPFGRLSRSRSLRIDHVHCSNLVLSDILWSHLEGINI